MSDGRVFSNRLLLMGLAPRLAVAAAVVAVLWAGFFWAVA